KVLRAIVRHGFRKRIADSLIHRITMYVNPFPGRASRGCRKILMVAERGGPSRGAGACASAPGLRLGASRFGLAAAGTAALRILDNRPCKYPLSSPGCSDIARLAISGYKRPPR